MKAEALETKRREERANLMTRFEEWLNQMQGNIPLYTLVKKEEEPVGSNSCNCQRRLEIKGYDDKGNLQFLIWGNYTRLEIREIASSDLKEWWFMEEDNSKIIFSLTDHYKKNKGVDFYPFNYAIFNNSKEEDEELEKEKVRLMVAKFIKEELKKEKKLEEEK